MKNSIIVLIALFISFSTFAQQGINYKAIIKDGLGNILASQEIDVKFSIIEDFGATVVYTEDHDNIMTGANGIIILNIGEGITTDVFGDINWGSDSHSLKTEIDLDNDTNYDDLGTTAFKAVPYALNVTGLEQITENDGTQDNTGWRLKGADPLYYAPTGEAAVDLSYSPLESEENGAKGDYSFATGWNSKALNSHSVAMRGGKASGFASIAIGGGINAASYEGFAIGSYNVGEGNPASWQEEDPLFEIGNGSTPITRRNAMTVFKNGGFVIGSSQMDNDTTIPDDDSRMFFNKIKSAFRAGLIQGNLGDDAQIGMYSTAFGRNNQAIGANSVALGENNNAIGLNAIAIGNATDANGLTSVALGADTTANGAYSTSMNLSTTADALTSTAIGRNNIGTGDPAQWIWTDPIFEIGNSDDSSNKTNALTVLKNGTITAPSFDLAEITDDKALITKEYLDAITPETPSGLERINEQGGAYDYGWALVGRDSSTYGPLGSQAIDLTRTGTTQPSSTIGATGSRSISMGSFTTASGIASTAMGDNTSATGSNSTAMGSGSYATGSSSTAMGGGSYATGSSSTAMGGVTFASGTFSTAMGNLSVASGDYSTAMGNDTEASGKFSTSMGNATKADSNASTAMGRFNVGTGNGVDWIWSDPLFEIGNGTGTSNRNNALTVLKNGKTGINTSNPASFLEVVHGNIDPTASNRTDAFSITNSVLDDSWQFHVGNANGSLILFRNGVYRGYFDWTSGAYVQASDRKLKKAILPLEDATLQKVMQLKPVSYLMKDQEDNKRNIGLISQEVQQIFPELTHLLPDQDILALSYTELIPILIKAMQEQQDIIESQNAIINTQNTKIDTIENSMTTLSNRLENLEAINN